jgi:phospholipase C
VLRSLALWTVLGLVANAVTGCASNAGDGSNVAGTVLPAAPPVAAKAPAKSKTPITHIVIMVQENRSFDDFFARYPGADGATSGKMSTGKTILLTQSDIYGYDVNHDYTDFLTAYDHGKMDGFDKLGWGAPGLAGTYPYQYVNPQEIAPYWDLAETYVLADHMFQTQAGGSFTAHQDIIAGGTPVMPHFWEIGYPSSYIWGCDAYAGTTTSLVDDKGKEYPNAGPFPCFTYPTMRDLLDAKNIRWKYYVPAFAPRTIGAMWNAFDAIYNVRYGSEWNNNISSPETNVLTDISRGKLPQVAWVIPDAYNSDHPQAGSDTGPSWIAQVVNALGTSKYWKSTAIIIIWDDWGGFYDHVKPKQIGYGSFGFRVPALFVSPYARKAYVSHTPYEFGSILRFVEDNWGLPRLGTSDSRATSIGDSFDFTAAPRSFSKIPAKYSRSYFLHQKPSNKPVDNE